MSHKPYRSNLPKNGKRRLNQLQLRRLVKLTSTNRSANDFHMNLCELLYKENNNPLYAWEALRISIRRGEDIPNWVSSYLGSAADAIFDLLATNKGRKARELSKAINLTGSMMKSYADLDEELQFYYRVEELLESKSLTESLKIAGEELKISRGREALEDHFYNIQKIVKFFYG